MKIAMVTTWRTACGVAKYTEELCNELSKLCELRIFAEHTQKELEPINKDANIFYKRCYIRGGSYQEELEEILDYKPDLVHVQFESSMYSESYNPNSLHLKFLDTLHINGIRTCMTFHNVLPFPNFVNNEVQQIALWYSSLNNKVIVGNETTKNEFLKWNKNIDISVIPLGSTIFDSITKEEALKKLGLSNKIYIIQPGFYGADKGMVQLVKLMPELLQKFPNIHLVFAGGLHPLAPDAWKIHTKECLKEIIKLNLIKYVYPLGKFLSEDELNVWLGLSDIVMLNYHWVSGLYSASASGHRVLCTNRPIIMNSQDVRLSEFQDGIQCCKADDAHMVEAISKCLSDKLYADKIAKGAIDYAHETSFESIAKKHMEIYEKCN
jgi:glycosyltransferase involved in cell wall biosynthesis